MVDGRTTHGDGPSEVEVLSEQLSRQFLEVREGGLVYAKKKSTPLVQGNSLNGSRIFSPSKSGSRNQGTGTDKTKSAGESGAGVDRVRAESAATANRFIHKYEHWKRVTTHTFDMLVVVDTTDTGSNTLLSDTARKTPLSFQVSMADLNLLQSSYFDNMVEEPLFFHSIHREDEKKRKAAVMPEGYLHRDGRPKPEYGTKEYGEYITGLKMNGEFLMTRALITIDCAMNVGYFVNDFPSVGQC